MYLGYQDNKIKFYTEQPLDETLYNLDKVEETEDIYVLNEDGTEYVLYDDEQKAKELSLLKFAKSDKNTEKCHEKLAQGSFELEIEVENVIHKVSYFYDDATQNNLNSSALGFLSGIITQKEWTDEDGNTVYLSQENIAEMLLTLESWGNPIWAKWGEFKKQIDACTTKEELDAIVISYDENEGE